MSDQPPDRLVDLEHPDLDEAAWVDDHGPAFPAPPDPEAPDEAPDE